MCEGRGHIETVFSAQFCCESKTAIYKIYLFKKQKNTPGNTGKMARDCVRHMVDNK